MRSNFLLIAFLLLTAMGFAQNVDVSGSVLDLGTGEPIPSVNIFAKDYKIGTSTDFDGNFTLSNVPVGVTLVFSYVGYNNYEYKVTKSEIIKISMVQDLKALEEVVLIGYNTKAKKDVTGSVSVVGSETIEDLRPVIATQALQGTVSGVYVSSASGAPGSGFNIRIRGISSNGQNGPLVLIDGYAGDLGLLNPNDIESITVLKDAQASVYGAQGANGVVLVTTKQGKKNTKTRVSFNSYTGFQETTKKLNVLNATEYALILNESFANNGQALPYPNVENIGIGTDWQDEVFQKAPITNNDFSISGGTDRTTYMLSASKIKQDGIVGLEKSGFDRSTARLAFGIDLFEKLNFKTNIIYTDYNRQGLNEGGLGSVLFNALNAPPTLTPYDSNGNYTLIPDTSGYGLEVINPLAQIHNTYNSYNQEKINGNFVLEYKPFTDFKVTTRYGFSTANDVSKSFSPEIFYGTGKVFNNTRSFVNQSARKFSNYTLDVFGEYEKRIFENHKFKVTLGGTLYAETGEGVNATGYDVPYNSWEYADIALANGNVPDGVKPNGSYKSPTYKRPSLFATLDYDYKGKYLLSLIARRDQSSKFGPDFNVGNFNSILAGWVISDEDFFNTDGKINFLKLRASYGSLGVDAIDNNVFRSNLVTSSYVLDGTILNGFAPGVIPNKSVKWESDTKLDIGLDTKMFNNKLEVTIEYYQNKRKDLLIIGTPVSGIGGGGAPGSGNPTINAGSVTNKGFEFAVDYKNNDHEFKYNIGFNITSINNNVDEVNNGSGFIDIGAFGVGQPIPTRMQEGQPIGSFFGYVTDGIFQNQEEVNNHPSQVALGAPAQPGDIRYKDMNGDGVINLDDRAFIGKAIADYNLGFNFGLNYKGFDFMAYSFASIGNDMIRNYERTENRLNKMNYVLGRWTGEGTSTEVPRVTAGPSANNVFSDYFVEDASFLRIQNIQLGYSLPSKFIENIKLTKVRIYGSINNVYTFTKYRGFDPAANSGQPISGGIDFGYYPSPRIYMLGLNVTF
ncbi:SusC/RagA family TonB-linked outer membrane protein [Flavobacterium sp. TP390]|uniref:SusC/RagA family TonB-linked outer membrane protein n=1 Tax=Flavobacterium profundi TaxID=1774945 RepID=A0A6I4ISM8_9FLAO|nr:TonB-dependent receptor [Flavobacterium profundi]MVO09347.1 SusC/RagA family TonB-linked outer membrane protein [Flavobacterium profundi]